MKVRFCGKIFEGSGYGEFSRYFIYALHKIGIEVVTEHIGPRPNDKINFGIKGNLCKKLTKQIKNPDINIVNMVPLFFPQYSKKGSVNIGFTMWEGDKLPASWVTACNKMDAIFVPCSWNNKVFKDSGVSVPIYTITPGLDYENNTLDFDKVKDKYTFYSIFEWSERKNPIGLLRAYFSEFQNVDDVRLILKTYKSRVPNSHEFISNELKKVQNDLNFKIVPEIQLITEMLSTEDLKQIHKRSHCFVLPHRSEGVGLPHMEAMSYGNPVIATGFSGNIDFMNKDNSYLIDYSLTPTYGMQSMARWYNGSMKWAEPDLSQLMQYMRTVYTDREEALKIGLKGQEEVLNNFNLKASAISLINACKDMLE